MATDSPVILVVDDEEGLREGLSRLLEDEGYRVLCASTGEQAFEIVRQTHVDLVLTDMKMPGMNGIELLKLVRKLPAYKFMPILFLTTESQQSKKMEAKAAGASGWIVKPATADELLNTIKLVLR